MLLTRIVSPEWMPSRQRSKGRASVNDLWNSWHRKTFATEPSVDSALRRDVACHLTVWVDAYEAAIWPRKDMAQEAKAALGPPSATGFALGQNVGGKAKVDM